MKRNFITRGELPPFEYKFISRSGFNTGLHIVALLKSIEIALDE